MVNGLRRIDWRPVNLRNGINWHIGTSFGGFWPLGVIALRAIIFLALILLGLPTQNGTAHAEPLLARDVAAAPQPNLNSVAERMNANTLTIVTGNPSFIFTAYGNDLAAVLNDGDDLRILPVASQGAAQNVRDVRFLRGIDLGFTVTNILGDYRRTGELGDLADKIVYIARISNDEIHVVTRSDITKLEQLRGRRVNFNSVGSGSELSARDIFRALNIEVQEVNLGPADAFEKLKTGEITATILTSGKPAAAMASLKASDGYHLLPVPLVGTLMDDYLPSKLTNADYPNLIAPGQIVETIAASSVLIAYNWPKDSDRYRRIDKFVRAFFTKFPEFQKPPRHPKWRETNLFATIPGWKRFEGAEEMVARYREQVATGKGQQFGQVIVDRSSGRPLTERDRNQLFEDFLKWNAESRNR
jgi:TRAP transporter TAXI family solute receptor